MTAQEESKAAVAALLEHYGSRDRFLFSQLERLALTRQRCDITLYDAKPMLNVRVEPKFAYALMYGAGAAKLAELLSAIELSNGQTVSFKQIWTINPMPDGGPTSEELAAVNLSEAEDRVGPNGETLRQMISQTYHCESREEEDQFLQRFIAS